MGCALSLCLKGILGRMDDSQRVSIRSRFISTEIAASRLSKSLCVSSYVIHFLVYCDYISSFVSNPNTFFKVAGLKHITGESDMSVSRKLRECVNLGYLDKHFIKVNNLGKDCFKYYLTAKGTAVVRSYLELSAEVYKELRGTALKPAKVKRLYRKKIADK